MADPDRRKADYRKGSEFGGLTGVGPIQPAPHDPANHPHEMLHMAYRTNPAANFPAGENLETQELPPVSKRIAE